MVVQIVTGQLLPEITIPPITIPPITIPPLPIDLPTVPTVVALVCPAGFQTILTGCYPCSTGTTSIAGASCTLCPAGYYAPGPGSAACFACSTGASTEGREACADAPAKGKGKGKA